MIRGVGVDTVSVGGMAALVGRLDRGVLARMFTAYELSAARERADSTEYLAARFAVKEAVFKAVAPELEEKSFDFRRVETRSRSDGSPYGRVDDELRAVLDRAGVDRLFVSITTEEGFATAFVVAESA